MNRRAFLASVSAVAVLLSLPEPSLAGFHGGGPVITFQGNPNVTISAIDTSGGVVLSRTSGKVPCFVQASARAIAATGTSVPYEDLSYSWNFGDTTGTETFINAATGVSVNANNGQTGPEAAYCYRSVGTYTVTLTIIGKNGSSYVSTSVTQNITVTAFTATNTWYYDAHATGANNGTSAVNAFTDITTIPTKVSVTTPTQIFLANGSHWLGSYYIPIQAPFNSTATGLRITPYVPVGGSTVRPIIEANGGSSTLINITNGGSSVWCAFDDIVISGIDLIVSGATYSGDGVLVAACSGSSNSLAVLSNIYFDNINVTTNLSVSRTLGPMGFGYSTTNSNGLFNNAGIWGGSVNSAVGDLTNGNSLGGGTVNFCFVVGLSNVNGTGLGGATQHHLYMFIQQHALVRWVNFGQGPGRNFSVKIDWYPTPKQNILGTSSGSGGVVRVQVADTSQFTTSTQMYVEDVGGTTEANGVWTGTVFDTKHIDLVGTVFVNAWTSGGDISPGGNTTAAAARYWLVDGNNITGTNRSFDVNNNHGTTQSSNQNNCVVQNNAIHDLSADSLSLVPIALSFTLRGNNYWNNSTRQFYPSQGVPQDNTGIFRVYRNKFYILASVTGGTSDTSCIMFYANLGSWANPQQFTDNIIVDLRTGAAAVSLVSYASASAWTIDRNQYYAPNATANKFLYNTTTVTAFGPSGTAGTWQNAGFDTNGSQLGASPTGWTVPPTKWSDFGA